MTASSTATGRASFMRANVLDIAYLTLAVMVFGGGIAMAAGPPASLRLGAVLLFLGIVPGAALSRRLFPSGGLLVRLVTGAVIGISLWSVGGMLSHLTGLVFFQWVPSALALTTWVVPRRSQVARAPRFVPLPPLTVIGAIAGLAGLLPALKLALSSEPVSWSGWYSFYTDVTFHVSLASEVAVRSPQVFPWAVDSNLSYPWLFHSAMGVWASGAGTTAAEAVMVAWPLLFAVLVPALLAFITLQITGSTVAGAVAPLLFVFARGLLFLPQTLTQVPMLQISPTRDFATLVALLSLLSLVHLLRSIGTLGGSVGGWWWLLLALTGFVSTGAKASEFPVLLGGLLLSLLVIVVVRKFRAAHLAVLATFLVAGVVANLLVLPDLGASQGLAFGPLTFLPPATPLRMLLSLVIVAFLVAAVVAMGLVIGRAPGGGWIVSALLSGTLLAGILGLAAFTHSGYSQLYFWQAAQPVLAVGLAWAVAILVPRQISRVIIPIAGVFVGSTILSSLTQNPLVVAGGVGALALAGALVLGRGRQTVIGVVVATALLAQAGQGVGVPPGVAGGTASTAEDSTALDASQLGAFAFIRDNSTPDEIVLTNKHCRTGSVGASCDPRWFALSAFSERRVLVEGWGYIKAGNTSAGFENDIKQSDDFVESPSPAGATGLRDRNAHFVYIDKRDTFSPRLGEVAHLVYDSAWASVYSLLPTP
jgi:hypothetical protein